MSTPRRPPVPHAVLCTVWVLCALCVLCVTGCTTKRVLEIDSNPSGAHIWVNGVHMKERTPVEVPFTYYGRFRVRLEKAGYDAVATEIDLKGGVDSYPIVDLFAESVTPEKRHRRVIDLRPQPKATDAEVAALMKRAAEFRRSTLEQARAAEVPERLLPRNELLP